ncbi:MAG: hypothetical protein GY758_21030 [Fuerstiella sp.]|nr:hypothetical protein [Fuerstiella sp.]MCP4785851.1 hypothetical protein [Fuerstiella sp.]MCP4854022.1 hypothetical protein [Fuerstiella sp.]
MTIPDLSGAYHRLASAGCVLNDNTNQRANNIAPAAERQSAAGIEAMQNCPAALMRPKTGCGFEISFFPASESLIVANQQKSAGICELFLSDLGCSSSGVGQSVDGSGCQSG